MSICKSYGRHKPLENVAFEIFLRTGNKLSSNQIQTMIESKFNPYHDPSNGQFTNAHAGRASGRIREANSQNRSQRHLLARENRNDLEIHSIAKNAMSQYHENIRRGMSPEEAAAWAANSEFESRGNPSISQEHGGPGRGYFQWGSSIPKYDRRLDFLKFAGIPIEKSTLDQQLAFRDWELRNTEKRAKRLIDSARSARDKAHAIAYHYLRPDKEKRAAERAILAEAILRNANGR